MHTLHVTKKYFLQEQNFEIFVIWLYCLRVTVIHSLILNYRHSLVLLFLPYLLQFGIIY